MKTLILSIAVADEHADEMRKHLERMAREDVRVSPVEFARRHGFNILTKVYEGDIIVVGGEN